MGLRLRHVSQHAAALTLLVVPLGCMSVGGHQLLVAENQTLEVANEKLSAAVEQYELDASTFEQRIFELEMLNASLGEREARIRIEAENLLDRVHTLESASLSVYIDASSLAEVGAAAEGASSAGLLSALTAEIEAGRLSACHDLSDGGLAVALAEMALAGDLGATIENPASAPENGAETPLHAWLFGEDQARYLITTAEPARLLDAARTAGVPAAQIGVTGGASLTLPGGAPISLGELRAAHEGWLPRYMGD